MEFYMWMTFTSDGESLITSVDIIDIFLDAKLLGKILDVPTEGVDSMENQVASREFLTFIGKMKNLNGERLFNKQLKGEYQLASELVKKVLLQRTKKRSISAISDLFLMEAFATLHPISLPAIMMEHMRKIVSVRDGKYGLAYGFLLSKIFNHCQIKLEKGTTGTRKHMFTKTTFEECECIGR